MNKYLITTALSGLLLAAFPASAQQTKMLTADKHNEYGLVYSLPLTSFRIEVKATRTVEKPGPYYQYAKKYLGTDKVVTAPAETRRITEVRITPFGTPDTTQYLMQLKPGALTEICVADDGMLLAVNRRASLPETEDWQGSPLTPSSLDANDYLRYVDEDFLVSQSSAKKAQMLAASIMEVRDSKVALSRGTAETMPTDGRQLELMLASLENQEKVMTEAFTGTVQTAVEVRKYIYTPGDASERKVLLRLSDFAGFVDADDLRGEPVYVSFKLTAAPELPVDDKGVEKKLPKDAVVYRLPASGTLTLEWRGSEIASQHVTTAQGGALFGLDPKLFTDKKAPSSALFDPCTGALLELTEKEQ